MSRQRLLEVALVEHQDIVLLFGVGTRASQRGQGQTQQNAAQHVGCGRGASIGAAGLRGHESARSPPRSYKPGRRARARPRSPLSGRWTLGLASAALGLDAHTSPGPRFRIATEATFVLSRDWPRSSRSRSSPASHWLPAKNFLCLDL